MPQANWKWRSSDLRGSQTPKPIELKFGRIDDVRERIRHFKFALRGIVGKVSGRSSDSTKKTAQNGLTISIPQNVFGWKVHSLGIILFRGLKAPP